MRGRLAVLVAIPLVVVVALSVVFTVGQVRRAGAASHTARSIGVATRVGAIVADLAQERLVSIGFIRGVSTATDLTLQRSATDEAVADLEHSLGDALSPGLQDALASVSSLNPLRALIIDGQTSTGEVITEFGARIDGIIDSMRLIDGVDAATAAGRAVVALDALMRLDELRDEGAAWLVATAGRDDGPAIIGYAATQVAIGQLQSQFTAYATPAQVALYTVVADAYTTRTGAGFAGDFAADPAGAVVRLPVAQIYPPLTSFVQLGHVAETKIAADVTGAVNGARSRDLRNAFGAALFALVVVLLMVLLTFLVARAVVRSLRALTSMADHVGGHTEAALRRVADDDAEAVQIIRFDPAEIGARDEFSDLADAFTRVQLTAAALVERQAHSRRNMAQMFGHAGRRTQSLVGRQLAMIDALALDEPDPNRLRELYRLDHVTSRMHRHASSLVVLSGGADEATYFAPLPLGDVIRRALVEIEDDRRVDIDVPVNTSVKPAVINDVALMLAELIENGVAFSPPHTRVLVTAEPGSSIVYVMDEGIGMSLDQLAHENRRLAQRERLDLAPPEVLGFFVVGRLARRHGIGVTLEETGGGGVTVAMDLGPYVLQNQRHESALYAGRALGRATVQPGGGNTRKLLWPEPIAIAAVPFDLAKLEHITKVLETGAPWNAFEVQPVQPALGFEAHAPRGVVAQYAYPDREPNGEPHREQHYEPHHEPDHESHHEPYPGHSDWPPGDGTTMSLARRVPGATTVHPHAFVAGSSAQRPLDPGEARELVEQFEFGVARAMRDGEPDSAGYPAWGQPEEDQTTDPRTAAEPAHRRDGEDIS